MKPEDTFTKETVYRGADDPFTQMMNGLLLSQADLCAKSGLTEWQFCIMLANVQGIIIGRCKDFPLEKANELADMLNEVVKIRISDERDGSVRQAHPDLKS